ncbi:MAG: hypothetical protein ACOC8G_02225 [Thermodesulfobacteriota bacterium]
MSFPAEKENLVDGPEASGRLVLASLSLSLVLLFPLLAVSPLRYSWGLLALALAAGAYLLILPAARLYWTRERPQATVLFNRASYFPLTLLLITLAALLG